MFTLTESSEILAKRAGLEKPVPYNTLLSWRRRYAKDLSETAQTDYNGDIKLTQSDIDLLAELMNKGKQKITDRKQNTPKPKAVEGTLTKLTATATYNTNKIKELESSFDKLMTDEIPDIGGQLEDQSEKIQYLENQINVLLAITNAQAVQIQQLQNSGMAFTVLELSSKMDKLISLNTPKQNKSNYGIR